MESKKGVKKIIVNNSLTHTNDETFIEKVAEQIKIRRSAVVYANFTVICMANILSVYFILLELMYLLKYML